MVAGGVPVPTEGHHAAIADCALALLDYVKSDPIPEMPGLSVRIGIDTGPVVAGVICEQKFAYDLWGDSVNTASRMQSHGLPNRIQVSAAFYDRTRDEFVHEPRGILPFKGKGEMQTYLLQGSAVDRCPCAPYLRASSSPPVFTLSNDVTRSRYVPADGATHLKPA